VSDASHHDEQLAIEAELWGRRAREQARTIPPEWNSHRALRSNALVHAAHIDELLRVVRPGVRALEIGCGSGWLSLALARHGALVDGIDVSDEAIAVARSHYESVKDEVSGRVRYRVADLGSLELPEATYDVVVAKGILHHLPEPGRVLEGAFRSLVPGGLLWISDTHGDEPKLTVLVAGLLMLVLPTELDYPTKLRALLRFGVHIPSRVKMSMEGHGGSPFEGVGRAHDWSGLVSRRFVVEKRVIHPALTGYLAGHLRLSDQVAFPLLRGIRAVDAALVRLRILGSTGITIHARKPRPDGGAD